LGYLLWHLKWWERLAFAEGRGDLKEKETCITSLKQQLSQELHYKFHFRRNP
jgi:hypothetical protein